MDRANGAIIFHNSIFVGPNGENLGPWTCPLLEGEVPPEVVWEHLLVQNFIAIPSPVFRLREARESGAMDESIWISSDWDFWLRLTAMWPATIHRRTSDCLSHSSRFADVGAAFFTRRVASAAHRSAGSRSAEMAVVGRRRRSVERVARASIEVNSALASVSRGERVRLSAAFLHLIRFGPQDWHKVFERLADCPAGQGTIETSEGAALMTIRRVLLMLVSTALGVVLIAPVNSRQQS